MTKEKVQLIAGALLHDIGKVIYRQGDGRKHSVSGYEFLKQEAKVTEKNILESVRYHHVAELRNASLSENSYAYITYVADNIASAADRRKREEEEEKGYIKTIPLESVFNVLNGNDGRLHYQRGFLGKNATIHYPTNEEVQYDENYYLTIKANILDNLHGIRCWDAEHINSLLEILEANISLIPSSTARDELADISLYDHVKLTAAIATCIYDFLGEKGITDYKKELFTNEKEFWNTEAFAMFSMDLSGIQDFIYTIHSEGALRNLRARSFYLEIMMEHIIDTLLDRLELSRANLVYAGGGHCYILAANTTNTRGIISDFKKELNQWMTEKYDVSLYVASGYASCCANNLKNIPDGSYSDIFKRVSNDISGNKANRYTAEQIVLLNRRSAEDYTRECKVCKKLSHLTKDGMCENCASILRSSGDILYKEFFSIISEPEASALSLPFGYYMIADTEESLRERMKKGNGYIRSYGKNKMFTGKHLASKIWVGDYTTGDTFEELAEASTGIRRIGILRADVDNLGRAFVSGFEREKNQNRYVTLSRTAALSRQLSMFFKFHINDILAHPDFTLNGIPKQVRKVSIVYSGGDDLFLVGAWDDVLEASVDIRNAFERYTEGTLSISAGIGLYYHKYPIHVSAFEVAGLEDESKQVPGKNAITFLPDGETHLEKEADGKDSFRISDGTYSWPVFLGKVINEKYRILSGFFQNSEDRGRSFLYHLLELVRKQDDKINLARYVYLLARMEPDKEASQTERQRYKDFSEKMYEWIQDEKDCRQLKTAITLYAYSVREKGGEEGT